jgi:hypothetical protein
MSTINGRDFQHATIDLVIANENIQIVTFKKLNYKVSYEKKPVMDARGNIIGFTTGEKKIDASMSMLLSEWLVIRDQLLQQNPGAGILQIAFDLAPTYGNSLSNLHQDELIGCMFQDEGRESQDNQDVLVVDLPLFVLDVRFDKQSSVNFDQLLLP